MVPRPHVDHAQAAPTSCSACAYIVSRPRLDLNRCLPPSWLRVPSSSCIWPSVRLVDAVRPLSVSASQLTSVRPLSVSASQLTSARPAHVSASRVSTRAPTPPATLPLGDASSHSTNKPHALSPLDAHSQGATHHPAREPRTAQPGSYAPSQPQRR
ncbi:hypothetical protein BJ138DRAFT_1119513 [Hygrophoropsis aurantiaca]|uniref:Uncharacterized protein n=1 Tax=Hygrophoropsis aurantiaca TaxID=72124 RepID=A0ACB7ZTD0_9AGAM|nr:hypothetical protein BJ138DRAFT_1119513 [Hygrophoropsis aurantiaca]